MAGGALKYRHLGRKSSHRQALLRNLVTSLFTHESISTTWPKAKEAQRLAEKVITLAKKNTDTSRRKAQAIFYVGQFLFMPFYIIFFKFFLKKTIEGGGSRDGSFLIKKNTPPFPPQKNPVQKGTKFSLTLHILQLGDFF